MLQGDGLGSTVAAHYDKLPETGIEARKESRIFHMRGFNNWVKSTVISKLSLPSNVYVSR